MSENLFERNQRIKTEADEILYQRGMIETIKKFGTPHISGSYALNLMTWRDLDVYLETKAMNQERFFDLGATLCKALNPMRMEYRNVYITEAGCSPKGYYWGIYIGNGQEDAWKVDVWAVSREECDRLLSYDLKVKAALTEAASLSILSLKSQCLQDPEYRRLYSSSDIYDAVLQKGVKDLNGFWEYLDKH